MSKLFDLSGRAALVTGGSRGLGLAMARAFAEAGADVLISSRHEEDLRAALDQVREVSRGRLEYHVADMVKRQDVRHLAEAAVEKLGRVDILVNNAGANVPQPIDEVRDEDWDRILELNLTSCMALTRALVPQMKARLWGRIIHISSVMGLASKDRRNAYSASKAALIGMTKASAIDLGAANITVNCIAPGPFRTELTDKMLSEVEKKAMAERTVLGRWGEPHELAGAALLLASNAGSYITGSVLLVDGGTMAKLF